MDIMSTPPGNVIPDPKAITPRVGSSYPETFRSITLQREKRALGKAASLTNFGVNLTTLKPGAWSAQRHWHSKQDELVYILDGELTLVTDEGEMLLTPGMAAGFKAGVANGHCLINKSGRPATYLEIGDRTPGDDVDYPDIDMKAHTADGKTTFFDKKGNPY